MFKTSLNIDVKGMLCELRELPTVKKKKRERFPVVLSMCCCEDVDCLHVVYLCRCTYNMVLLIIYLSVWRVSNICPASDARLCVLHPWYLYLGYSFQSVTNKKALYH